MKVLSIILCLSMFLPPLLFSAEVSPIEARLTEFIRQMYDDQEGIRIKFTNLHQYIRDKAQTKNIAFAKVPDANGEGICLVETGEKNGRPQMAYVPFKVSLKKKLFVTKRDLKKGDVIRSTDLSVRETLLTGPGTAYPSNIEEVQGKVVRKDVPGGTVLTCALLDERQSVQKGELVDIIAKGKALLVQAKGRVLEKGKIGDVVRVKNIDSGKDILAKVIGSDAVTVEF
jgi:flagellar basal body P-ring formation protein FlgA